MMYVKITEPNHAHYERRCLITMSEYGFLTVTLLPLPDSIKKEEFIVHTSMVTETEPEPDDMYYEDFDTVEVNEEGFVIGLNNIDSHGNERTRVTTDICLGRNISGQIEDGDDSSEDEEENLRTYETYYVHDEETMEIDEEGMPVGYHDLYDSDGNTRTSDDEPMWETDFPPGNENHVNENGEPFDLHEFFDSDGKPIRNFPSESSESESSKSETTNKN